MSQPDCPLCLSPRSMLEGPLGDGGYFCNGCGKVIHLDATGHLLRVQRTNHTAESAFRQALKKLATRQTED